MSSSRRVKETGGQRPLVKAGNPPGRLGVGTEGSETRDESTPEVKNKTQDLCLLTVSGGERRRQGRKRILWVKAVKRFIASNWLM